jgi:hypothetical protein
MPHVDERLTAALAQLDLVHAGCREPGYVLMARVCEAAESQVSTITDRPDLLQPAR